MRGRVLLALPLLIALLAGCLTGDDATNGDDAVGPGTGEWPRFELPETVTDMEFIGQADDRATTGAWIHEGLAYLSGGSGLRIVDVRDPANPLLLAEDIPDTQSSRDVDIMVHPNGRLYAVLGHNSGFVTFVDVTDPTDPVVVAQPATGNSHNIAVVPNSTVVYNSRSISTHVPQPGATGEIDIIDFADPDNPQVTVFAFPAVAMTVGGVPRPVISTTCHDVTFTAENQRAYCAGVTNTQVWDVADPLQPTILQVIDWPMNQIHHGAWGARGGDLLIIGDEFAGAAAGPMCSSLGQPYAALWFFDISDLSTPLPLGWFQVEYDSVQEGDAALCTTHFGTLVDDRDLFVLSWYTAGTVLIDFSDPMFPEQVAHFRPEGSVNTWDARYWNGHVFTGDTARGMDILRLT